MPQRYYLPGPWSAHTTELTGQEAHHLLHVMRARVGDQLEVFDGEGSSTTAVVASLTRKAAQLELDIKSRVSQPDPSRELILATAVPKKDRFRWLIEKATELGVRRIQPLHMERSTVKPRETKLEKHRQYVIEACKQSGRNHLLKLEELQTFPEFCHQLKKNDQLVIRGTHASANTIPSRKIPELLANSEGPVILLVGPEGGLTDEEISLGDNLGMTDVSAAPYVLRTETAGISLAAILTGFLMTGNGA